MGLGRDVQSGWTDRQFIRTPWGTTDIFGGRVPSNRISDNYYRLGLPKIVFVYIRKRTRDLVPIFTRRRRVFRVPTRKNRYELIIVGPIEYSCSPYLHDTSTIRTKTSETNKINFIVTISDKSYRSHIFLVPCVKRWNHSVCPVNILWVAAKFNYKLLESKRKIIDDYVTRSFAVNVPKMHFSMMMMMKTKQKNKNKICYWY